MRLRYDSSAEKKLKKSKYLVSIFPYKVDKNTIIELGMGKGEMITQLAYQNPNKNYLGIEKYATVAAKSLRKAENLKINNFKIICQDIKDLPKLLLGKVDVIWLTFSDPWPKDRHEKRRLTYKSFLQHYKKILTKQGVIKFKTDNDKFFKYSIQHMEKQGLKLSKITNDFHSHKSSQENIMTGYEKKWSEKGKKINYLEARF